MKGWKFKRYTALTFFASGQLQGSRVTWHRIHHFPEHPKSLTIACHVSRQWELKQALEINEIAQLKWMQVGQVSGYLYFPLKAKNIWQASDWNRRRVPNFRTLVKNWKVLANQLLAIKSDWTENKKITFDRAKEAKVHIIIYHKQTCNCTHYFSLVSTYKNNSFSWQFY